MAVTQRGFGFVYYAHAPALEAVKIGFTKSEPTKRLRGLMTERFCCLSLIGALRASYSQEAKEHARWAHLWLSREWFLESTELLQYARSLPVVTPLVSLVYRGKRQPIAPHVEMGKRRYRLWHPPHDGHLLNRDVAAAASR